MCLNNLISSLSVLTADSCTTAQDRFRWHRQGSASAWSWRSRWWPYLLRALVEGIGPSRFHTCMCVALKQKQKWGRRGVEKKGDIHQSSHFYYIGLAIIQCGLQIAEREYAKRGSVGPRVRESEGGRLRMSTTIYSYNVTVELRQRTALAAKYRAAVRAASFWDSVQIPGRGSVLTFCEPSNLSFNYSNENATVNKPGR